MIHPYKDLPDYCFWSRAVTWGAPGAMDPFVGEIAIRASDRVATMGSCFAQHLSRHMQALGFHYLVSEPAPAGLAPENAHELNYGVFSARFGNVYTVRQALQLFERAWGAFTPVDDVWQCGARFVDAFRPRIQPYGWLSIAEVREEREKHLACVRDMFIEADWLVFTLGLTEAWRSKEDGAVYPIAPGVAGGTFDPARYEFVNFGVDAVRCDLRRFIERLRSVNSRVRIILTVSPVPLVATYERRHVVTSTTLSKAVLRVAADEAEREISDVVYFPAYEIITSSGVDTSYFDDTLRGVTGVGVAHVMRAFSRALGQSGKSVTPSSHRGDHAAAVSERGEGDVVCDEEVIDTAIRVTSGGVP